mmetsp:Transcript_9745/g.28276  ORF Transcript_9745/g.28276 Transcript_9745/m.28276 type:complete len:247 (+) Transcript_9745:239-979(+)
MHYAPGLQPRPPLGDGVSGAAGAQHLDLRREEPQLCATGSRQRRPVARPGAVQVFEHVDLAQGAERCIREARPLHTAGLRGGLARDQTCRIEGHARRRPSALARLVHEEAHRIALCACRQVDDLPHLERTHCGVAHDPLIQWNCVQHLEVLGGPLWCTRRDVQGHRTGRRATASVAEQPRRHQDRLHEFAGVWRNGRLQYKVCAEGHFVGAPQQALQVEARRLVGHDSVERVRWRRRGAEALAEVR